MNITLKLYASLGSFLPPDSARNSIDLKVREGASIGEVLAQQNVPRQNCHLILVNGTFAPPASADATQLAEGDTLAVWPPVAGG